MTYRMLSGTFVQFYNDDGHFLQPATLTNVVVVYLLIMWCSYKSKSTFRFDFSYWFSLSEWISCVWCY